ncbi:MAG: TlpA disulfide reductase family protein [Pirellulaceae bacterium]
MQPTCDQCGNLPAFLISTRRSNSFYSNPNGVIGLQNERSLENLKSALEVRKFDESLSSLTDTWAWKDNQVVAIDRHKYVYEGDRYDQQSARTWDGHRGWWRDSTDRFGRYRGFSDTFQNHYFRPCNFLYLGDHQFKWAKVDEYPTFFVNAVQSVKFANYQSLPDEDFAGERCFVIRSIPRAEQFWVSQESGKLLGCLTFINQGQFTPIHEMESLRRMAGQTFENRDAANQWIQEEASNDQRHQLWADWAYLHRDNQRPHRLVAFSDYREVAPGIELPHTEWQSSWMHEDDKYQYNVVRLEIERVTTQPDLTPLIEQALPKKGDTINDWRFSTWVKYAFDPEMPEATIHQMADKAQAKLLENQRAIDDILNPLKAMVGQQAPKLTGQPITGSELPKVATGSRTLIHFWAVWCGPCKNDIPTLNRRAKNGLNVIGVHAPGTQREEIEAVIKETGMDYPVILGKDEKLAGFERGKISGYPVGMFPCCVLIDKDGNVEAIGSLDDVF